MYYGALCKIKANKYCGIDPLYKTRVVTIQFGCNKRISSSRFKGTLDNYGYDTHGRAALKTALLRKNDLLKYPIVVITINIRHTCRCSAQEMNTNSYHPECEVHSTKRTTKCVPKNQKKIDYFLQKKI